MLYATLLLRHKNLLQRDQNLTNWNPTAVRGVERLKKWNLTHRLRNDHYRLDGDKNHIIFASEDTWKVWVDIVKALKKVSAGTWKPFKMLSIIIDIRMTTKMATRTRQNKTSNGKNNNSAGAFYNSEHFLAVLCKTTTWITKICVVWEEKLRGQIIQFCIWNPSLLTYICMSQKRCGAVRDGKHIRPFAKF